MPTVLVVNEFASSMLLSEHFKTIVFGIHYKSKNFDEAKLILLAKTLANRTLNDFINKKDSFKEYDEFNDGTHISSASLLAAIMRQDIKSGSTRLRAYF